MACNTYGSRARRVSIQYQARMSDCTGYVRLTLLHYDYPATELLARVFRFSLYEAGQLCVAANAAGVSPIIRVPENTSGWISRSFDAGAQAVIVPHIEVGRSQSRTPLSLSMLFQGSLVRTIILSQTAEAAARVVRYSRFHPRVRPGIFTCAPILATDGLPVRSSSTVRASAQLPTVTRSSNSVRWPAKRRRRWSTPRSSCSA